MDLSLTGIAIYSNTATYRDRTEVRPGQGTEACWITPERWVVQCPDDPANTEHGAWSFVDSAGARLGEGMPFARAGGGVFAASHNAAGYVMWQEGQYWGFVGRVAEVAPNGVVFIASEDHTRLSAWISDGVIERLIGVLQFTAPILPDDTGLAVRSDGRWLVVKTDRWRAFDVGTLEEM